MSSAILMNEFATPGFWERQRFFCPEKSDHFHILAISIFKVCDAKLFSWKNIELCSADRKLLIETMIEEIEVVL